MSDEIEKIPREREAGLCPCKSREIYAECCMPFHYGRDKPTTALQLMRARYSAYFFRNADFLVSSMHPASRWPGMKEELETHLHEADWSFLTILGTSKGGPADKTGKVEFIAEYFSDNERSELHEKSRFKRFKGQWKYLDDKG
ncbi:YchJ family protein [Luteolibacter algae]|uniref:YchJ family protein n=1 Tax=Luteolibacter algae TaxID=454151 RepID=A0ABW5D4G2_9BACT